MHLRRLLLVDGEPSTHRMVVEVVGSLRMAVDSAATTDDARAFLDRHRGGYAAAIVEVGAGDAAALELVRTLLMPVHACCPLAITEGAASRARVAELWLTGRLRTLSRPVARDELVHAIRATIANTLQYRARLNSGAAADAGDIAPSVGNDPMVSWLVDVCGATAREVEIARLVHAGLSNERIATKAGIVASTVKQRMRRLQVRCGVESKAELRRVLVDLFGRPASAARGRRDRPAAP